MRPRCALTGGIVVAALLALPVTPAAAMPQSLPAQTLFSRATWLSDHLALLGKDGDRRGPREAPSLLELRLTNRDGHTFTVVAFDQTVGLIVSNASRRRLGGVVKRESATAYLAHGTVTPTSIDASFGDRGEISVRFHPSGREMRATRRAGCARSSNRVIAQLGLFAGQLRFRGEGGYASAEVHRARGRSIRLNALNGCLAGLVPPSPAAWLPPPQAPSQLPVSGDGPTRPRSAPGAPGVATHPDGRSKPVTLIASRKQGVEWTIFGARVRDEGMSRFVALDQAVDGRVGIVRFASVRGPSAAFRFEPSLARASVIPPVPFGGEGIFEHGVGGTKSWAGSLTVSFLGAPRVPIAGALFSARLAQAW
jgi:hypothetical protein